MFQRVVLMNTRIPVGSWWVAGNCLVLPTLKKNGLPRYDQNRCFNVHKVVAW